MRIVIAANHYPVASGRYMADAFRRLGHDVKTIGPEHGQRIWGLSFPPAFVWTPDALTNEYRADLLIVMDSDPQLLEAMLKTDIAPVKVVYGVDNHVRHYGNAYDHYFLAHYHGPTMPVDAVNPKHTWLPCGYDPTVFKVGGIPFAERAYDVALIGVLYPRRREIVQAMRDAGLKVYAGCGLVGADAAAVYQNARVSLCISAAGDVAQRIFETMACGCHVLSDPLLDYEKLQTRQRLPDDDNIAFFKDTETAIRFAQAAQHANNVIDVQAVADAVTGHSWDDRARVIEEWFKTQ